MACATGGGGPEGVPEVLARPKALEDGGKTDGLFRLGNGGPDDEDDEVREGKGGAGETEAALLVPGVDKLEEAAESVLRGGGGSRATSGFVFAFTRDLGGGGGGGGFPLYGSQLVFFSATLVFLSFMFWAFSTVSFAVLAALALISAKEGILR